MNTYVPGQHNYCQLASRALIMNTHVPGQRNYRQLHGLARTHYEHTRSWST